MRSIVKKQTGITLIALVVTIIVLIILAGVSIAMLVGENGIITQAQRAERETANATIASEEQMNALVDEMNGYLAGNGEISGIFSDVVTSSNYGDYVDYPIDLNNNGNTKDDWRIFYNDGENVFIIAADYVESNSTFLDLSTAEMYKVLDNPDYVGSIYSMNWYNSITSSKTLSVHTGNDYINNSIATIFMYNKYYLSYPNSNLINSQMSSSLLDTSAWNKFVNLAYAEYAIGGPTLEMWIESYNSKGYSNLYYNNINDYGYYIGTNESEKKITLNINDLENNGYNDTLYIPHKSDISGCNGYWFASPTADGDYGIWGIAYKGTLAFRNYDDTGFGIRPVVSLKSSVTTIRKDGIWNLLD